MSQRISVCVREGSVDKDITLPKPNKAKEGEESFLIEG